MISLVTVMEAFCLLPTETTSIVLSGFWVQEKEINITKTMNLFIGSQGTSLNRGMQAVLSFKRDEEEEE